MAGVMSTVFAIPGASEALEAALNEFEAEQELLETRFTELVTTAMLRVMGEKGGVGIEELMSDDFGERVVMQLEMPVFGGSPERWEVIIGEGGRSGELRQLYYSQAGQSWMKGVSIVFDPQDWRALESVGRGEERFLGNDEFFEGVSAAFKEWPVAKLVVNPL